jgi:Cu/Ag efflux protein CusF
MLKSSAFWRMAAACCLSAIPVMCALAQEPTKYTGKVTAIDAAAKTLTVADSTKGSQTVKIGAATLINTVQILALSDIQNGDGIQAVGQMSADGTSLTARSINIQPDSKPRKSPAMAAGKAVVTDGKISIDVKGTAIAITPGSQCSVSKVTPSSFDSIKVGMIAICNMGANGEARVVAVRGGGGK